MQPTITVTFQTGSPVMPNGMPAGIPMPVNLGYATYPVYPAYPTVYPMGRPSVMPMGMDVGMSMNMPSMMPMGMSHTVPLFAPAQPSTVAYGMPMMQPTGTLFGLPIPEHPHPHTPPYIPGSSRQMPWMPSPVPAPSSRPGVPRQTPTPGSQPPANFATLVDDLLYGTPPPVGSLAWGQWMADLASLITALRETPAPPRSISTPIATHRVPTGCPFLQQTNDGIRVSPVPGRPVPTPTRTTMRPQQQPPSTSDCGIGSSRNFAQPQSQSRSQPRSQPRTRTAQEIQPEPRPSPGFMSEDCYAVLRDTNEATPEYRVNITELLENPELVQVRLATLPSPVQRLIKNLLQMLGTCEEEKSAVPEDTLSRSESRPEPRSESGSKPESVATNPPSCDQEPEARPPCISNMDYLDAMALETLIPGAIDCITKSTNTDQDAVDCDNSSGSEDETSDPDEVVITDASTD